MSTHLNADHLKDDLLRIHATLIPKILMMDYDFKDRLVDNEISIAVVYENHPQKNDAVIIKRYFEAKYPDGFQNHKINIEFIAYDVIRSAKKHTLYYLLPSSEKQIKNVLAISQKQKAISFSYRGEDLKYGVMLSVKISNKVKPIINVDALKQTNVTLRPVLLKVADIFYQTSSLSLKNYDQYSLHIL